MVKSGNAAASTSRASDRIASTSHEQGALHKPAGLGSEKNVLGVGDPRVAEFFAEFDRERPFKVGLDSRTVPGVINFCKNVAPESLDTCEGGRFSCYIGPDLVMVPCSFDQERRYEVQLRPTKIAEAWGARRSSGSAIACAGRAPAVLGVRRASAVAP